MCVYVKLIILILFSKELEERRFRGYRVRNKFYCEKPLKVFQKLMKNSQISNISSKRTPIVCSVSVMQAFSTLTHLEKNKKKMKYFSIGKIEKNIKQRLAWCNVIH